MCPSCSFCPPILLWAAKRHQIFACALLLQLSRLALRITQSGLPLTKETVDFLRRRSEVRRKVMTSALLSFSLRDLGPSIGTRYPHEYCDCDHQSALKEKTPGDLVTLHFTARVPQHQSPSLRQFGLHNVLKGPYIRPVKSF